MKNNFRCDCPITSALDVLGDKWILVIVKQMLLEKKQTFKDFTESDESVATNILTTKLNLLVELKIVTKSKLPGNKKSVYYHLTERGLSLATIVVELAIWSDENLRDFNSIMGNGKELTMMKTNKIEFINMIKDDYIKNIQSSWPLRSPTCP